MDKSRRQFEEEFRKYSTLDKDDIFKIDSESDDYYYLATRQAWHWWQASRESLEVELPQRKGICHNEYDSGYFDGIDKCEDILISNGVKIKNE
ncbi:hypothetical protein LW139_08940 [Proteus vulgaris]|uniref:hypothetical protein n=1 Tax=Proteus vulgaris TaxID=585 RepID=UPI0020002431|nr:hypothetical protein [Proteus vulgaris]UPK82392.1 hypothetical protein LW139_06795 [Proteus vulgaris]UPK82796.1 hypothetical protein LW139_08940 [Proteus vulgaris]